MKINPSKILFTLFGIFVLLYVGSVVVNYFYTPFEVETVRQVTVDDTIDTKAIALRNEKVVTSNKQGVAVYSVENGGKLAKGADVISYYSNDEAAAISRQISDLQQKIDRLSDINTQSGNYAADIDIVSSNVTTQLLKLDEYTDGGDLSNASVYSDELFYAMCRSGVETGRITNLNTRISELEKQLNSLKKQAGGSVQSVTSDYAGYFVNTVDGYENAVDITKVNELTTADFDKLKASDVPQNAVGKVICDTNWYLVAKLKLNDSRLIKEGGSVDVTLPLSSGERLEAEVLAMNIGEKDEVLCVLSLSQMNPQLLAARQQDIQIVVDTYTGLRVNKDAVRVKNGKKGVYVTLGNIKKFREINVVYSAEDYVIVDSANEDGQLKIYDDVIIKGKGIDADE